MTFNRKQSEDELLIENQEEKIEQEELQSASLEKTKDLKL